jgi:ABC-type transporter Mla maintaining outer membrane lipid asymmetry permease subunit MlaE
MSLVGSLIAISLLLLAGVGVLGVFLMGRSSSAANDDDPKPRGD